MRSSSAPAELDNCAVAGALDDAPVMHGEDRIDQVAAKGSEPSKDSILVRAGKSRVADDIGDQNGSDLARFRHGVASGLAILS